MIEQPDGVSKTLQGEHKSTSAEHADMPSHVEDLKSVDTDQNTSFSEHKHDEQAVIGAQHEIESEASHNLEVKENTQGRVVGIANGASGWDAATVALPGHALSDAVKNLHEEADEKVGSPRESSLNVIASPDGAIAVQEIEDSVVAFPTSPQDEETKIKAGQIDDKETEGGVQLTAFEEETKHIKTDDTAEFELDSSPYESSSGDVTSSTTSSDGSDDDYELLSPEEQARRLMQEDGGSDDEDPSKSGAGASSGPLRTQNEKPDEIVPKPNIVVTSEMKIEELGCIENIVENVALIKAKTTGEYQVLETGSVLCLKDGDVIGVIAETWGRVQQPYYSVRFTNAAAIPEAGISKGTQIFYVEKHSTTVFTQPLKAYKGSDASNLHDEEVGDDEMDFSDDEKEAEHKRMLKQAKQARRGGKPSTVDRFSKGPGRGRNIGRDRAGRRGGRALQDSSSYNDNTGLSYDDVDIDGPYNPLARPNNLHEMMGRGEAPTETQASGFGFDRSVNKDERTPESGRLHGREDSATQVQSWRGYTHPFNSHGMADGQYNMSATNMRPVIHHQYPYQSNFSPQNPYPFPNGYAVDHHPPQSQPNQYTYYYQNQQQQNFEHQPYHGFPKQAALPSIPPGAFVNPAFFSQSSQANQYWPAGSSPR